MGMCFIMWSLFAKLCDSTHEPCVKRIFVRYFFTFVWPRHCRYNISHTISGRCCVFPCLLLYKRFFTLVYSRNVQYTPRNIRCNTMHGVEVISYLTYILNFQWKKIQYMLLSYHKTVTAGCTGSTRAYYASDNNWTDRTNNALYPLRLFIYTLLKHWLDHVCTSVI